MPHTCSFCLWRNSLSGPGIHVHTSPGRTHVDECVCVKNQVNYHLSTCRWIHDSSVSSLCSCNLKIYFCNYHTDLSCYNSVAQNVTYIFFVIPFSSVLFGLHTVSTNTNTHTHTHTHTHTQSLTLSLKYTQKDNCLSKSSTWQRTKIM